MSGSKVDRNTRIISGVSVVTAGVEAKGHKVFTDFKTLETVKACASEFSGGVRVKANHGTGVESIIGTLKNFRIEGDKLLADLHLLEFHDLTKGVMEMAESMPTEFGLSISFMQTNEKIDGKDYARCQDLFSADLVDRPAVNPSGLFHRVDSPPNVMADTVSPEKSILDTIRAALGMSVTPIPVNFEAKAKELETNFAAKVAELTELQAKHTDLQAKFSELEKKETEFAAKIADFDAKVEKAAADKAAAINAALGVPPVGNNGNGGVATDFSALVQDRVITGKVSKAQAIRDCIQSHPSEYVAWKASGKTSTL